MLTSLALYGLYAATGGAAPVLDDVTTVFEAGRLTVNIATSEPVEVKDVWTKLARGRVHIYFPGGKVRSDRRRFIYPDRTVEVLPRAEYAKVEVPWGEGAVCTGPVAVEETETGVRVGVGCRKVGPTPSRPAAAAAVARTIAVPAPAPAAQPVATPPPPVATAPVAAAPIVAPPPPLPAAAPAPALTAVPEKKGGPSLILPGLLLIGIAGGAVFFSRRKARNPGLIEILESASLGPKRSLIIARVNGEVMVLGSSEAGITFLGAPRGGKVAAETPVEFAPMEQETQPLDEGGLLARLFGRREQVVEEEPPQMDWKDFDDLLAESREDQDLRRKLAAGLGTKVS